MAKERRWKKVENTLPEKVMFDKVGDAAEGYVLETREITTKHGPVDVLIITDAENKKATRSVFLSAALALTNWEELMGAYVRIEYTGDEKNPKTGRTFKAYDVMVDEATVPEPELLF